MVMQTVSMLRSWTVAGAMMSVALAAAGCARDVSGPSPASAEARLAGPVNTGTYPTFGTKPVGATAQFTKEQQDQVLADLNSAKGGQGRSTGTPAQRAEELKRLQAIAKQHGPDTLTTIEGE